MAKDAGKDVEGTRRKREMKWRLTGLSLREIKDGLKAAASERAIVDALKIAGEKWEAGTLMEAWVVDCLTLPKDEQIRRAKRGQAIVERIRMRGEPGPPLGENDDAVREPSVEAGGGGGDVPGRGGRGKKLSKPSAHPDPAFVLGTRPLGPKKR